MKREGLTKRELHRISQTWRDTVRETIKTLPMPQHATAKDAAYILAAVRDEVDTGHKIVSVLALAERLGPRERRASR